MDPGYPRSHDDPRQPIGVLIIIRGSPSSPNPAIPALSPANTSGPFQVPGTEDLETVVVPRHDDQMAAVCMPQQLHVPHLADD